jgi:Uma2 family endonuclease
MSTALKRRLLTEEEYLLVERQANQKSEFVHGEMFAMAGANDEHETIAGNCFGLLWQDLSKRGCKVYKGDMKVRVSATGRFTYPDVVVVCGERHFVDDTKDVLINPMVIIEVLSESTTDYDGGDKSRDYRLLSSLRNLLIISQDQPLIEHFVRQDKNTWNSTTVHGMDAAIELSSIGCSLRLADIFSGIEFPASERPSLRITEGEEL